MKGDHEWRKIGIPDDLWYWSIAFAKHHNISASRLVRSLLGYLRQYVEHGEMKDHSDDERRAVSLFVSDLLEKEGHK